MSLTSVAAAREKPQFALVEAQARAGDAIHFSIAGARGSVTYELEIGPHDVVEDAVGAGSPVTGEFTLPHLGDSERTVDVKAEIRAAGDKTTVKAKLRYLGSALPPPRAPVRAPERPPAPAPEPDPPAAQLPAAPPAPAAVSALPPSSAPILQTQSKPSSHGKAARRRGSVRRKPPTARTGRGGQRRHAGGSGRKSRDRKRHKTRRARPRTAPLFDGVPEQGAGNGDGGAGGGYASPNSVLTPGATVAQVSAAGDAALSAAIVVPLLLGIAGLTLTGAAVQRRRHLRSAGRGSRDHRL